MLPWHIYKYKQLVAFLSFLRASEYRISTFSHVLISININLEVDRETEI